MPLILIKSDSLIKRIKNSWNNFTTKYNNFIEKFQLTIIYLLAFLDLFQIILRNFYVLGYFSEILRFMYPLIRRILISPIFRIWASPEKIFILSYLFIEIIVIRGVLNLSKLVKYNILLIFSFVMIEGLILSYWELIVHRQIPTFSSRWTYTPVNLIRVDRNLAVFFFLNFFGIFSFIYSYLYIYALRGKFATIPTMEWLTDSLAFWLYIKTPTMRFGNTEEEEDEDL